MHILLVWIPKLKFELVGEHHRLYATLTSSKAIMITRLYSRFLVLILFISATLPYTLRRSFRSHSQHRNRNSHRTNYIGKHDCSLALS
jgi:hypothetical protein